MDQSSTCEGFTKNSGPWEEALVVIFALASAARHHPCPSRHYWDRALRVRGIQPPVRKSFWLKLMNAAGLIDSLSGGRYRPSALLPGWFARPSHQQARDLIEAWVQQPKSLRGRQDRRRIIRKLAQRARLGHALDEHSLSPSELHHISALRLLGIWDDSACGLTDLGRAALQARKAEQAAMDDSIPSPAWQIETFRLQALGDACHLPLRWELEAYLQPYAPARYLLTPFSLRLAAQRGCLTDLISILERGSGESLSEQMRARILDLPQARLLSGTVLEFDSPEELAELRRRPALRSRLDAILSPRHIYLPPYAQEATLAALARAGIPIHPLPAAPDKPAPDLLSLAPGEAADLLALALAAQELDIGVGASPDLVEKLSATLPPALLRAARDRAARATHKRSIPAPFSPPSEPGIVPPERINFLQRAADREEALTIWYWQAGAVRAEQRRVTPLVIEQRGVGLYMLAFCHRRRANRTFRLDRLLLEHETSDPHGPSP